MRVGLFGFTMRAAFAIAMAGVGISVCIAQGDTGPEDGRRPETLRSATADPLLVRALYSKPERIVHDIADSGAVSVNSQWEQGKGDKWYIEQQRYGADLVQAGVARHDDPLIQQGLHILDWGFKHQGPDGSFPGTGDPFHSTSFFVEASARTLLLLKSYNAGTYADVLEKYTPHVLAAALWLNRPEVAAVGKRRNLPYAHRRWLLAAALGETGALTKNDDLIASAEEYAKDGIAIQTGEGIDPEKGGGDVSYQAVGLLFAARYCLVCPDPTLRGQAIAAIRHGLDWESTLISDDGEVNTEGSTRITSEHGRSGEQKNVDYKNIVQAFVLGSVVTGKHSYHEIAEHISAGRKWTAVKKRINYPISA